MKASKATVAKKTLKDPELIDMFNKMVGASDPDPNIVLPKYEKIYQNTKDVINILSKFCNSPLAYVFEPEMGNGFQNIRDFTVSATAQIDKLKLEENNKIVSGPDLNELNGDPNKLAEFLNNIDYKYNVTKLGERYASLKDSSVIKELIMIARNLKSALVLEKERAKVEKHDLENKDALSANFILHSDGDFLRLFNFSTLNFKEICLSDKMDKKLMQYLLLSLHLIHKKVLIVVKEITSPDIDVDRFSILLIDNIEEIRKHIPRCDKAFDKIRASIDLLKNNFGEYYKDFVTSQNPGIIIEHFVLDVAGKSKADTQTTAQFREIIKFYRKNMQAKITDPKVKKIFSMIGDNLDVLEDESKQKKTEPEDDLDAVNHPKTDEPQDNE